MRIVVTQHRSGRSSTNVIVAIFAVVAVLCLIVPAIVAARSNARRLQCENNINQIGLSLCNFTGVHQRFPSGTLANDQLPPESRLSWYYETWGYVGDGQLELSIDRHEAWNAPQNLALRGRSPVDGGEYFSFQFDLFCCPSLELTSKYEFLSQTSYVGPSGVGKASLLSPETRPQDGIWGYDRSTAIDQLCDGLDNTALLVETSTENGPWTAGGPPTVRALIETEQPACGVGRQFGGLHAGVTNVAYADGSVRPMNDDIDMSVLVSLVAVCDSQD